MKRIILAALTVALAGVLTAAQAQSPLGRLKDKVKEKTDAPQTRQPNNSPAAPSRPAGDTTSAEPASNPGGTVKTAAQSGQDAKYPPGLLFSSLLTGMRLHHDGRMTFDGVAATFLPPPQVVSTKHDRPYNPYDGGKLDTVIRTAGGNQITKVTWFAKRQNGPFWLLESFLPGPFIKMTPGDYVAEFILEGRPFYSFPFSIVREGGGDDPFAAGAGDKLVLKGAWENFGYLHMPAADPSSPLQFKSWFRGPVKKNVKFAMDLLRDGKKVAEVDPGRSDQLATTWERLTFEMRKPNSGPAFTGNDLLATDGQYKLVVRVDGQPYGTYPFAVQGGKIQYHPRQRRGEADPLTLIEGGNDAWFVERQK